MHYGIEDAKNNVDYFGNKSAIVSSEPLMATLVFYLSNVTQGGEILFPKSEVGEKSSLGSSVNGGFQFSPTH